MTDTRIFPGWWQVVAALVLQAASSASVFTAYSVIAVPLQETFEPSRMLLMMGITAATLATGTLGAPLGAAIDRFSLRVLMLGGTLLLGSGFVLLSFSTSMSQVLMIYFLPLALGCVLTGPVAGSALLARWFSRRRGLAMSIAASGSAIGGLVIPPLLQLLIDTFEWRMALQIYGVGVFLVTAPPVALLVVNRPGDRQLHPDGAREPPLASAHPSHAIAGSMLHFLRNRNFWLVAITLGLLLSGPMALLSSLVPFALGKGLTATEGAILLSVFSGANFVGKLASGVIADRVDYRLMLAAIALLISASMYGYLQSGTFQLLILSSVVLGMSQGAIVPLWSIILAKIYGPDNMGRSMGLMGLFIMPFTLVAPPLFGRVYDLSGSYGSALVGCMVLALCTLGLIASIRTEPATPAPNRLTSKVEVQ